MWQAETLGDLQKIVSELIPKIQHKIIFFEAEMGAGKTTLIREMANQLGCTSRVNSPTYTLVNEYETPSGLIYHFDLYRITSIEEAMDLGWEMYEDSGNNCWVEWPDFIKNLVSSSYHTIQITKQNEKRIIKLD